MNRADLLALAADAAVLRAAINHAIKRKGDDGLQWLKDWAYGDPAAMAELDAMLAAAQETKK